MTGLNIMGADGNFQPDMIRIKLRNCIECKEFTLFSNFDLFPNASIDELFLQVCNQFQYDDKVVDIVYILPQDDQSENSQINLAERRNLKLSDVFKNIGKQRPNEAILIRLETLPSDCDVHRSYCNGLDNVVSPSGDSSTAPCTNGTAGTSSVVPSVVYGPPTAAESIKKGLVSEVASSLVNQSSPHFSNSYSQELVLYSKTETGFVGLVNQAMTCYMNSLFQTLFMTPEFRNALYVWEFDGTPEEGERSIPYQLQRLFVQLQTSKERSVKTNDVTRSFGWDNSDIWLQHDIQELCRVMFDALEVKLKDTPQAALINRLYQGKMRDYVHCLSCGHTSAREDTYLDIQLAIRPFGSTENYSSVEESLEAFTRAEKLEGANQYSCERCEKKVDAEKGISFLSFPYLLTLQLMRFAFDFNTLNRVKLNDYMSFPFRLNLNKFIERNENIDQLNDADVDRDKTDNLPPQCGPGSSPIKNGPPSECEAMSCENGVDDDDESMDEEPKGPYIYELFSVMVHSGSAVGGHYYAYIKSFTDNQWYCFNDQNVTVSTEEEVKKTYGGCASGSLFRSGYSSSMYTSSTNAYMLMYRRVDPATNKSFVPVEDCPAHIKKMIEEFQMKEAEARRQLELDLATFKIKVLCKDPRYNKMVNVKLEIHKNATLAEATDKVYKLFHLDGVVNREDCRLIKYEEYRDIIDCSFDDESRSMESVLGFVRSCYNFELLLEIKNPNTKFRAYKTGGITLRLHLVDLEREVVSSPVLLHIPASFSLLQIKQEVAKMFCLPIDHAPNIWLVEEARTSVDSMRALTEETKSPFHDIIYRSTKLYVELTGVDRQCDKFLNTSLFAFLDKYQHTINIQISLPSVDAVNDYERQIHDEELGMEMDVDMEAVPTNNLNLSANRSIILSSEMKPIFSSLENVRPRPGPTNEENAAMSSSSTQLTSSGTDSVGSSECPTLVNSSCTGSQLSLTAMDGDHAAEDLSQLDVDTNDNQSISSSLNPNRDGAMETEWTPPASPKDNLDSDLDGDDVNWPEESTDQQVDYEKDVQFYKKPYQHQAQDSPPVYSSTDMLSIHVDPPPISAPPASESNSSGVVQASGIVDLGANNVAEEECPLDTATAPPPAYGPPPDYSTAVLGEDAKRFCTFSECHSVGERLLQARIDKRMTLSGLKKRLEPVINLPSDYFKVFRVMHCNQDTELTNNSEIFSYVPDDTRLNVRLGRIQRKDETKIKVYIFDLLDVKDTSQYQLETFIKKTDTIREIKRKLSRLFYKRLNLKVPIDRMRMRRRYRCSPGMVLFDKECLERDSLPNYPVELVMQLLHPPPTASLIEQQQCDNNFTLTSSSFIPEKMNSESRLVFVRRWWPSRLEFDEQWGEIIVNKGLRDLDQVISQLERITGIPSESIEIARPINNHFPAEQNVLEAHTKLDWYNPRGSGESDGASNSKMSRLSLMDDGVILFFRDSREPLKSITPEERKILEDKENTRLGLNNPYRSISSQSSMAPSYYRKEKALKIYTDDSKHPANLSSESPLSL